MTNPACHIVQQKNTTSNIKSVNIADFQEHLYCTWWKNTFVIFALQHWTAWCLSWHPVTTSVDKLNGDEIQNRCLIQCRTSVYLPFRVAISLRLEFLLSSVLTNNPTNNAARSDKNKFIISTNYQSLNITDNDQLKWPIVLRMQ